MSSPKLRDWQAYIPTSLPSDFEIPQEGKFLLPVCTDAHRLDLLLMALTEWKQYDPFPERYIFDHMIDVLEALAFINNPLDNPCVQAMLNLTYEVDTPNYRWRWLKNNEPFGDWIPIIKPNFEFEGTVLKVDATSDGVWDTQQDLQGQPGLDGANPQMRVFGGFIQWKHTSTEAWSDLIAIDDLVGEPGQNAPVPLFAWEGYQLKIDQNADGIFDVTSPSLRGATGEQGATGQPGQNAPIPLFAWESYNLKIDPDADGDWDVISPNLRGADGQIGQDGQSVESVSVNTLPPGSEATADYNATTGHLTLGIPGVGAGQGSDVIQNIYSLPPTTDTDKLCNAAWALTEWASDSFKDVMETANFGQTLTFGLGQMLASWFPPAILFGETIEFATDAVPEAIFTWLVANIDDPDAKGLMAEKIFCALQDNYPDISNFWGKVFLDGQNYLPDFNYDDLFSWENLAELAEIAYNSVDGANVGWLTLGFLRALSAASDAYGTDAIEPIIAAAFNNAQFFDSRNCEDFGCDEEGWSHVLSPDDPNITYSWGDPSGTEIVSGCQTADWIAPNKRRQTVAMAVAPAAIGDSRITRLKIDVAIQGTIAERYIYNGDASQQIMFNTSPTAGNQTYDASFTEQASLYFWVATTIVDNNCPDPFTVTRITLYGTGTNPFL